MKSFRKHLNESLKDPVFAKKYQIEREKIGKELKMGEEDSTKALEALYSAFMELYLRGQRIEAK